MPVKNKETLLVATVCGAADGCVIKQQPNDHHKTLTMSRQTFLSKEFFVNASEQQIYQAVLTIPQFVDNIRFVRHHTIGQIVKFVYETPGHPLHHYVYVSLLPLTNQQTRVALSVSYTNGQVFGKDSLVAQVLTNFEGALYAALQGKLDEYQPEAFRKKVYGKLLSGKTYSSLLTHKWHLWKSGFQKRARLLTLPGRQS